MFITFDPEADAVYVAFQARRGRVARTREIGGARQVDYDAAGEVLGVEFLWVSDGIDLTGVPRADEVAGALRAFPSVPDLVP